MVSPARRGLRLAAGARSTRAIALSSVVALLLVSMVAPLARASGGAGVGEMQPVISGQPQLRDPITIRLGKKGTQTELRSNQDYIIKLPPGRKTGHTVIIGGRNILIEGGTIVMKGKGSDLKRRAIYIKDATGTVTIKDVAIKGRKRAAFDAIAIDAPQAEVRLINLRVTGLYGNSKGFHGDIIQPFGGVKKLVVDGLTGRTSYQGFYLEETSGRIGSVELSNIDLAYLPNRRDKSTVMIWFAGCNNYPVSLNNVYIQPRKGQRVAPESVRGCSPRQANGRVTWPGSSKISGSIIQGSPANGAFVAARGGK